MSLSLDRCNYTWSFIRFSAGQRTTARSAQPTSVKRHFIRVISNLTSRPYICTTWLQTTATTVYSMMSFRLLRTLEFVSASVRYGVEHFITTTGPPVYAKARRLQPDKRTVAKVEFNNMAEMGIFRRSGSPWASPLHMVPKSSGGWRPCGDYRRLNDITVPGKYPVPHIQDFFSQLAGATFFSKIDLVHGYHQIHFAPADISKTAVIAPFGLFEFLCTPFGLKNAALAFQRLRTLSVKDSRSCLAT